MDQNPLDNITLGDMLRGLARYRTALAVVLVLVVAAVISPDERVAPTEIDEFGLDAPASRRSGGSDFAAAEPRPSEAAADEEGRVVADETAPEEQSATAPSQGGQEGSENVGIRWWGDRDPMDAPDCDPKTGRIAVPSRFAPPCVPVLEGPNPGKTHSGVTQDAITIAVYLGEADPAGDAALQAAGVGDSREQTMEIYRTWFDYFQHHWATFGRKVELVFVDGSGDDDAAARADAIEVAEEVGAFASLNSPSSFAYADELAARGVITISPTNWPVAFFADRAPYVWGSALMSSEQAYTHVAEYIGKRIWGAPAVHAGDAAMHLQERKFGLVYFDTAEGVHSAAADFFEQELAKYGASLTERISYDTDVGRAQEQAGTVINKLQASGVTSVIVFTDPIYPIFFTQEATRQGYFPEWIYTGSIVTDTNIFGRAYAQEQWENAFGVGQLWPRGPIEANETYFQFLWHHDEAPPGNVWEPPFQTIWTLFTGIHMAGPNLNPTNFRNGLFAYPFTPGGVGQVGRSFGDHGLWPSVDYTSYDDTTEIWWDPNGIGQDEFGKQGKGMICWVNGGQRYAAGEWPSAKPKVFDTSECVHQFDEIPPEDEFPRYEHRHSRWKSED